MQLNGKHIIADQFSKEGSVSFYGNNPEDGTQLPVEYHEATESEVENAVQQAEVAFQHYRKVPGKERARFLEQIAEEIMALGDALIARCAQETGLPEGRLQGERGRTVNQLKMFASLLKEGSWLDARIDTALPNRQPLPRPDLRQIQIALGPVGIFGASNFPLAFSVAGGDTASALAAGCSIVVKAHPAHPGTSEMVGRAIAQAAKATGMPKGVFSLLHGHSPFVGMAIVNHPLIKAVGFTGSFKGGKALFDAANRREEPIPVYAEMGSINPVFVLPEALREKRDQIAQGLVGSVTLGAGQFCTNPGVVMSIRSEENQEFIIKTGELLSETTAATMLTDEIAGSYQEQSASFAATEGVKQVGAGKPGDSENAPVARVFQTDAATFLDHDDLSEEVFGPSTLHVDADNQEELLKLAVSLEGHLTATIHATEADLKNYHDLVEVLERKVGRLIINGFPTGVEVCHAMVHGGPFPATTDARTTSVGTLAIQRFTRPVCYQDFPHFLLPEELHDHNPLGIWRMVNGERSRDAIGT